MRRLEDLLDNKIAIGVVANTHGMDGLVKLYPYTNVEEVIYELDKVLLYHPEKKRFFFSKVVSVKPLNKYFLIEFDSLKTISEAEKFKGYEVYIEEEKLPELEDDEYYKFELVDSEVFFDDGEFAGYVIDVISTGSNDVISVKKNKDRYSTDELLFPVLKKVIVSMDKKNKKIVVKRLEWDEDGTTEKD